MKILIVDDDRTKATNISKSLLDQDQSNEIYFAENYQTASSYLFNESFEYDLIVLDWCFPFDPGSKPKYVMGRVLLNTLLKQGNNTNTIICSSEKVDLSDNKYPFVLDSIIYDEADDMGSRIYSILGGDKEELTPQRSLKRIKDNGYKRHMSSTPWWVK